MKVVHIILGKANPERLNGVNKVVYSLASMQASFGKNVSVWGIAANTEKNYPDRNFETKIFFKSKNPFSIPRLLKKEILKSEASTVFHLHGGWIPVYFSLAKFLTKHQKKYVITAHGAYNTIAMRKSFWIKKIYFQVCEKYVLQHSEKIHCIGQSEVEGINKIYSSTKNVLIPYGYKMEGHRIVTDENNKDIIWGFVGRIDVFTKGLDILLEAFFKFQKMIPSSKLWIIGDGEQKDDLKKLIQKLQLDDKVALLGSKFGKEKDDYIGKMDVFMHPSRNEGLPISVIEAASMGKPCIVSRFTNVGDFITKHHAGISVSKYSASEFALAMFTVYKIWKNKEEFKTLQVNAVKMVTEELDWVKNLSRIESELYV